jgi:deoxyribonuclease V
VHWPATVAELAAEQERLAAEVWTPWRPHARAVVGATFVCFSQVDEGRGEVGDNGYVAAAVKEEVAVVSGAAGAGYEPGALALREGELLERAVRALPTQPEVLIVDATGRDHPLRCGLALHLGAVLDVPTVGITHRPLAAVGDWPPDERGATSPLRLGYEHVGYWLRTKKGTRPLAVHAGWRTGPEIAVEVILNATGSSRTPEPLRRARTAARRLRADEEAPNQA